MAHNGHCAPPGLDRFANVLQAWVEVDGSGRITDCGYDGGCLMGSTTVKLGPVARTFEAIGLPDIFQKPVRGDGWVRFVQTAGGRTGVPAPRRVRRRPFVQWQAPLVWTTLSLTINADGTAKGALTGASRFPRHWIYDDEKRLSHRRLAEYGPGALLGERAHLEGGERTSTLVAVTPCRVAVVEASELDRGALQELSKDHRRTQPDRS